VKQGLLIQQVLGQARVCRQGFVLRYWFLAAEWVCSRMVLFEPVQQGFFREQVPFRFPVQVAPLRVFHPALVQTLSRTLQSPRLN